MVATPSLKLIVGIVAAILTLHVTAIYQEWYWSLAWIDIVLHVLGGAWVAFVFFYVQSKCAPSLLRTTPFLFSLVLIAGFVMLVGVVWEWFEFGFDVFFAQERAEWRAQLGLVDTMGDLFADLVGGVVVGLYGIIASRKPMHNEIQNVTS
jgi:hypothetical protein